MTGTSAETGRAVPEDELIATHVAQARNIFAVEHPRLDRAELDVLVHDVSDWSQPDSGWQQVGRKANFVEKSKNALIFAKTVFAAADYSTPQLAIRVAHSPLFLNRFEEAFQSEESDEEILRDQLSRWSRDGRDARIRVASVGRGERKGSGGKVIPVSTTLAIAKFGYDNKRGRVITRVGTRVIPDGRTTEVPHEVSLGDFGKMFRQGVQLATVNPNRAGR